MSPTRLAMAARDTAMTNPALVGFDPITILTIITALLPIVQQLFSGCFNTQPTPASTREHVLAAWDGETYDKSTMRVMTHHARVQARKAGSPVDHNQASVIAEATLDKIRLGSDDDLQQQIDSVNP